MSTSSLLGIKGEQLAKAYLENLGFQIIERNYKTSFGEIDIIAQKDQVIHFIEVKTRTSSHFGFPYEAVDQQKVNKIKNVINFYCLQNSIKNDTLRIGIISIILKDKKQIINYYQIYD